MLTLGGSSGYVRGLAFSPDGRQLAVATRVVGAGKDLLKTWDAATGAEVRSFTVLSKSAAEWRLVGFSPDGRSLVIIVRSADWPRSYKVQLLDAATGAERLTLEGTKRTLELEDVAFSPDGRLIAAGGEGRIWLWDGDSGKLKREVPFDLAIRSLLFHPDGPHLIVAAQTGTIYVLRLAADGNGFRPSPSLKPGPAAPVIDAALRLIAQHRADSAGPWKGASAPDALRRAAIPEVESGAPADAELVARLGDVPLRAGAEDIRIISCSPDGSRLATLAIS